MGEGSCRQIYACMHDVYDKRFYFQYAVGVVDNKKEAGYSMPMDCKTETFKSGKGTTGEGGEIWSPMIFSIQTML